MAKQLEYFFDYGSPFSYLADTQIAGIVARTAAAVLYKPMLLGAVFKATGNRSPIEIPAKRKYMAEELARWAKRYGVPMKMNPHFPVNTLAMMRGAVAAQSAGRFPEYHQAMFRGMWVEGLNLSDPSVYETIMKGFGIDPEKLRSEDVKAKLHANTDEAVARGVFGAPAFFVGQTLFWGNDRLDFVEEALK